MKTLFVTSICMTVCTSMCLFRVPFATDPFLYFVYFCGDVTSMWNHGCHSKRARVVDRLCMIFGACVDALRMRTLQPSVSRSVLCATFVLSITSYFASKSVQRERTRVFLHGLAHFFISISHTLQLCTPSYHLPNDFFTKKIGHNGYSFFIKNFDKKFFI